MQAPCLEMLGSGGDGCELSLRGGSGAVETVAADGGSRAGQRRNGSLPDGQRRNDSAAAVDWEAGRCGRACGVGGKPVSGDGL